MENTWNRSDDLLDLCLTAMREEGRSVEDCLARYPESVGMEPLLRTAARLQEARRLRPAPRFQDHTLQRLRRQAKSTSRRQTAFWPLLSLGSKARPVSTRVGQRLALLFALLAVVVLIATGIGTVTASAQALPGDWLYPVKRAQEEMQFSLAGSSAAQADLHLVFASRRLSEATELVKKQRTSAIEQTLADFDRHVQADMDLLAQGDAMTPAEQAAFANRLILETSLYETSLAALAPKAPDTAQRYLASALQTSRQARSQAQKVIQSSAAATPTNPTLVPSLTAIPTKTALLSTSQAPTSTVLPTPLPAVVLPTRTAVSPTLPANILPRISATPTKKPTATKLSPNSVVTRTPSTSSGGNVTATRPAGIVVNPTATPNAPQPTPDPQNFGRGP